MDNGKKEKMKRRWVLSRSGLRHIVKGKVYLCNQAVLHTGNFVKASYIRPTCANCLMRIGKYKGVNGNWQKNQR